MWRDIIIDKNFTRGVDNLITSGFVRANPLTGRCEARESRMDVDSWWVFSGRSNSNRNCLLWKDIMFHEFGLIPEFCRFHCHKVVAKPRTFRELKQIYGLMQALPYFYSFASTIPGKCGVDPRTYTFGPYAAFWYADSMVQGIQYYEVIKDALCRYIDEGEKIPLVLKKACTEMEAGNPTDGEMWKSMSDDERIYQDRIEDVFDVSGKSVYQPEWLKNKIIAKWAWYAYGIGDQTVVDTFGGKDVFGVRAVTYHGKPKKEE
jgi:hypothetical protein